MIIPNYFEKHDCIKIGTQPVTNYFVPYQSKAQADSLDRRQSAYYHDLNGTWDFVYFDNVRHIDHAYWFDPSLDHLTNYQQVTVPSVWQLDGFGQIQYTNVELPIPFDPPYSPYETPAGLYRRDFTIHKLEKDQKYELCFEGVDAAYYLWVNQEFLGFSTISHNRDVFDVTPMIKEGVNQVAVLVVQWGLTTYFENQDKFRWSGIFRDVYLLERKAKRLDHFLIRQDHNFQEDKATVWLSALAYQGTETVSFELVDPSGQLVQEGRWDLGQDLHISLDQPIRWSAENPALYILYLDSGQEIYRQEIGLRQVEIRGVELYINNQSVKLQGVNHHDTHPKTGPVVSVADQVADLHLIKSLNFNAIRTSHYPKSPEFYEWCDRIGFYVMSEADLECHEVVELIGLGGYASNYNMLANDPVYQSQFVVRNQDHILAFRNMTSIIMWTAGNESGFGLNFEVAGRQMRQLDPSRPLHFEGFVYRDRDRDNDTTYLDVYSRMYCSFEEMDRRYFDPDHPMTRPFLLCEYSHAMGNSNGDLEDYYQYIEARPGFIGAFVWEWADHAVDINRTNEQVPVYRYGGDFGEYPHFGNFCMDGLVYPDRRLHPGALEYQQVYRPIRLVSHEDNRFSFQSRLRFNKFSDQYTLQISYFDQEGRLISQIPHQDFDLSAMASGEICLDCDEKVAGIKFDTLDKKDQTSRGFDFVQVKPYQVGQVAVSKEPSPFTWQDEGHIILVQNQSLSVLISKATGLPIQIKTNGQDFLAQPAQWQIWRAPIDNDRRIKAAWYDANYDKMQTRVHDYRIELGDQAALKLSFKGALGAVARQNFLSLEWEWTFGLDGGLDLAVHFKRAQELPYLPRLGLQLPLLETFDSVTYLGLGPVENYIDRHQAVYPALFEASLQDLYEPYVTPQENGNRSQVDQIKIANRDQQQIIISKGQGNMSFSLSAYSSQQMTLVRHRDQLVKEGIHYLNLDYKQSGVGTSSCGPDLLEIYRLDDEEGRFEWQFSFSNSQDK